MSKVLYHQHYISKIEIEENQKLIEAIISGRLRSPQVKKMVGVTYQKEDIFRAKIDKKNRLIYTYIQHEGKKTLLILAVNNHNYKQLKRQFGGSEPKFEDIKELTLDSAAAPTPEETTVTLTPAVSYKQMTLLLDDCQQEALHLSLPLMLSGPPGAGKTAILYNIMLSELQKLCAKQVDTEQRLIERPILFISQSAQLLTQLNEDYKARFYHAKAPVIFTTWQELYPRDTKFVSEQAFAAWIKEYFPADLASVIHYEMSLFATLPFDVYMNLGKRQSYFTGNKQKQTFLRKVLISWQEHLKSHGLIDPMVTPPVNSEEYSSVYCDEAQNQPPIALDYLIKRVMNQQFVACLDSEQCLITSPYIQNCLKELLHVRFGQFTQQLLPRTWRCSQAVTRVSNQLMKNKYALDGGDYRREYREISSAKSVEGRVSWITPNAFAKLKTHGALASTVVIADEVTAEERKLINSELGSNNILTAKEVIGLDFTTAILWTPISQKRCLKKLSHNTSLPEGLSLEQWNSLNALYVSLSRAERDVYVYEPDEHIRNTTGNFLLGDLPVNDIQALDEKLDAHMQRAEWQQRIEQYLAMGMKERAAEIMRFNLHMSEKDILEKIEPNSLALQSSVHCEGPAKRDTSKQEMPSLKSKKTTVKKSTPIQPTLMSAPQISNKEPGPQPQAMPKDAIPNTPSPATKAKSLQEKREEYLNNLIKNVTEPNLVMLFKNKNVNELLFKHPLNKGQSVFQSIINNIEWRKIMVKSLINNPELLVKVFTAEVLCDASGRVLGVSTLHSLSSYDETRPILCTLLLKNPSIAKGIRAETLCQAEILGKKSPLFLLAATCDGRAILKQLFAQSPVLAKEITAEAICRSLPNEAGVNANRSALYYLTGYSDGRAILSQLLAQNPALAKGITAEALCLALPKEAGAGENQSALYFLASCTDARSILSQLLAQNPDLAVGITAEALCRGMPKEAGAYANQCPLYFFSHNADGLRILSQLLTLNPNLAKGITAEALCRALPKEAGTSANQSALYHLVGSSEGLNILNQLLAKNPELTKGITGEAICRLPYTAAGGVGSGDSVLYLLTTTPQGRAILKQLINQNPQLAKEIHAKALCKLKPREAGDAANRSALFNLSSVIDGINILKLLLMSNPDLGREIDAKDLCRPLTDKAGAIAHQSVIYLLSSTDEGVQILINLSTQNPKLAQGIDAKSLCRHMPKENGRFANQSALFFFCTSGEGQKLLSQLLAQNSELSMGIDAESLCRGMPREGGQNQNCSALYGLSFYSFGHTILLNLLAQNPSLVKGITAEALCRVMPQVTNDQLNKTCLLLLSSTSDGLKILDLLLTQNAGIAKGITAEDLCRARPKEEGKFANYSALAFFTRNSQGISILNKILAQNPSIAAGISTEVLQREYKVLNTESQMTSVLAELRKSEDGKKILQTLGESNPVIKKISDELPATPLTEFSVFSKEGRNSVELYKKQLESLPYWGS